MSRRLQYLYQIDVMMESGYEMTPDMAIEIATALSQYPEYSEIVKSIEEREDNFAKFCFRSGIQPSVMIKSVEKIIDKFKYLGIYYVDMVYCWPYDVNPDRIVLWADGRWQEYTSMIMWNECNIC